MSNFKAFLLNVFLISNFKGALHTLLRGNTSEDTDQVQIMANHGIDEQNIVDAISVFLSEPNINFQREACGIFAELTRVSS